MKSKKADELKYRKRKKLKKIIASVTVLAALAVFGVWFALLKYETQTKVEKYDFVIPYEKRDVSTFFNASGSVEMSDAVVVSSDVSLKIKKINFHSGDFVSEGDVVIEFDGEELDEKIEAIQKSIDAADKIKALESSNEISQSEYYRKMSDLELKDAELLMNQAKESYKEACEKYEEYYNLYYNCEDDEKSMQYMQMYKRYEAELDEMFAAAENAEKNYQELKDSMSSAASQKAEADKIRELSKDNDEKLKKTLDKLKEQRENLTVKSPKSGVISDLYANEGGIALKKDLFKVGSMDKYKIKAYILTRNIMDIKEGMDAEFTSTLTGDRIFKGKVVKVSDIFDEMEMCYSADIEIDDSEQISMLKPNIDVFIKIYTRQNKYCYAVPYDAIITQDGESWVYKIEDNGKEKIAKKVSVKTGQEAVFYTEITESDLREGDLIVCGGKNYSEGDRIKIRER